jgi:hypothetical protein
MQMELQSKFSDPTAMELKACFYRKEIGVSYSQAYWPHHLPVQLKKV